MIVPPRPQNVCGVNDEGSYSHNPFDFGAWLRFDAAAVTKIKIWLCRKKKFDHIL